jgi:hypothetical protein
MKNLWTLFVILSIGLGGCGSAPAASPSSTAAGTAAPTSTITPTSLPGPTALPTETIPPQAVPTRVYPAEGYGPSGFPAEVDALTGLPVTNPALLQRRPMLVKVSNLPRSVRPQWGLSLADIVFEYYTEEGSTRFAAVFYGNDASLVGPIRSGRFIDAYLVQGYKAVFAFGSAYEAELNSFLKSDFANRMVVEAPYTPLKRYDPNDLNYLVVNTADLSAYATMRGINGPQALNGMLFKQPAPAGGQPAGQVFVHYSGATYGQWEYDPASGKYLRFSDTADVLEVGQAEQFAPLTDRLNDQQVAFDNVVVLYVNHSLYSPGIYDIKLTGSGTAVAFRDGQGYQVKWQRSDPDVVSLTNPDGSAFPFKPGTTFFEVIGLNSTLALTGQSWRFTHAVP